MKYKKVKKKKYAHHVDANPILLRRVLGLSLRRDSTFIPNLVACFGVVFVWRGMRNLIDMYFFPDLQISGNILAILIGVFLLYLPDDSFRALGGYKNSHNHEQIEDDDDDDDENKKKSKKHRRKKRK